MSFQNHLTSSQGIYISTNANLHLLSKLWFTIARDLEITYKPPHSVECKTTLDAAQTLQIASAEESKPFGQQVKKKEYLKILEVWGVLSFNEPFKRQTDIHFSQKRCADTEIATRIMGSRAVMHFYIIINSVTVYSKDRSNTEPCLKNIIYAVWKLNGVLKSRSLQMLLTTWRISLMNSDLAPQWGKEWKPGIFNSLAYHLHRRFMAKGFLLQSRYFQSPSPFHLFPSSFPCTSHHQLL